MIPLPWDLVVTRGDDCDEAMRIVDDDPAVLFTLDGLTGKAQVRANAASDIIVVTLTVTPMLQAEVPGGFVVSLTPAQTAALAPGVYVWDCEFANASRSNVDTWVAGAFTVNADVTR